VGGLQLLNNKKTDKKVAAVETTAPVKEKEDIGLLLRRLNSL